MPHHTTAPIFHIGPYATLRILMIGWFGQFLTDMRMAPYLPWKDYVRNKFGGAVMHKLDMPEKNLEYKKSGRTFNIKCFQMYGNRIDVNIEVDDEILLKKANRVFSVDICPGASPEETMEAAFQQAKRYIDEWLCF
ncbi:MAG: hypothetical protein GC168_19790 [Candidatus Hydrogenedens sp.]|nr:hypothetical protein [Candidatus Hydrogenedens sp.]